MGHDVQGDGASAHVRAAILDYLEHNRDAADSARGINTCWLPPDGRPTDIETVERVLDDLVKKGLVVATCLADGTVVYRRPIKT
jgi:Fe2+ or Zn2+ uptake regulation protein